MKYLDEFRDNGAAARLSRAIRSEVRPGRRYNVMEFCGGHTHAIFRYGLMDLLPDAIRLIHGPGCPVCVLPVSRLDMAIRLARDGGVILCSYGDMLRVPGSGRESLSRAMSAGADVRVVYSVMDALSISARHPDRDVVFLAIGFEATAPATALAVARAKADGRRNFAVLCNHMLTLSAVQSILESSRVREMGSVPIDAFVGPGHVSAVIGTKPFEFFCEEYQKPVVVAGFEPLDILAAILALVRLINAGRFEVANEYPRAVTREGNRPAQGLIASVFELRRAFEWRSLGEIPYSGLRLRSGYADFDAERRYGLKAFPAPDPEGCLCGAVLRGVKLPTDCRLFGKACTPEEPIGACMVSAEGTCAAYFRYRPHEDTALGA